MYRARDYSDKAERLARQRKIMLGRSPSVVRMRCSRFQRVLCAAALGAVLVVGLIRYNLGPLETRGVNPLLSLRDQIFQP